MRGDLQAAEAIGDLPDVGRIPWMDPDATDELASFALEACRRSHEEAKEALTTVQGRASAQLTLVVGLVPLVVAVVVFLVPRTGGWQPWIALALLVASALMLVASAVVSFLASGLVSAGSSNPAFMQREVDAPTVPALMMDEADAWYHATEVAMINVQRKVQDLFLARRLLIFALLLAIAGVPFLYSVREGGEPAASVDLPAVLGAVNLPW